MTPTLRVDKSNLSSRTYEQIRSALMNGEYSPGDRIRIANMAESLGISITPVREAIFRLVSEQALEMTAATSIKVPQLDAATVAEIQLIRRLLEGAAAEKAAGKITKDRLDHLAQTHDRFIEAVSKSASEAARINRDFHFELIAAADMPNLYEIVGGLWVRMGPLLHVFHSHVPARAISNDNHPHYRVLKALRVKDGASAAKAIQEDIAWGERILLEWMSFSSLLSA
ncbi:GntR family transcriptional regulator [Cupriavidus pinatubonensis]|uniref:HTH-type transcriptional regulator McbR n=1 Tax=Cupriavidus pinatubonensis TaxID=248026 RepID=A0ABN7YBK7_9BURK|nr:GntR family transcriptional regulator [Cupriavidus pinatubonensis]CAG9170780.1 HTH-type transcriptional regulator McbR [Cupriavidus pinatubonensis]